MNTPIFLCFHFIAFFNTPISCTIQYPRKPKKQVFNTPGDHGPLYSISPGDHGPWYSIGGSSQGGSGGHSGKHPLKTRIKPFIPNARHPPSTPTMAHRRPRQTAGRLPYATRHARLAGARIQHWQPARPPCRHTSFHTPWKPLENSPIIIFRIRGTKVRIPTRFQWIFEIPEFLEFRNFGIFGFFEFPDFRARACACVWSLRGPAQVCGWTRVLCQVRPVCVIVRRVWLLRVVVFCPVHSVRMRARVMRCACPRARLLPPVRASLTAHWRVMARYDVQYILFACSCPHAVVSSISSARRCRLHALPHSCNRR